MRVYLPELVVPGRRLGRHVGHDPRSLWYLLPETATQKSVTWERHIPILDQGDTSSCTGNAITGALGTGPLWDALNADLATVPALDEKFALNIYSDAEKLDGGAGLPTEDDGSFGLSVAKVAKIDGYLSGYQHATSLASANTAIARGPFIIGTYWMTGMDDPTAEGIVKATGTIRGGHEYLCREYDAARDLWWFDNSWSTAYGVAGRFAYDSATLVKLLAGQGDITSLVPLTVPAPSPAPVSSSLTWDDPTDLATLRTWSHDKHTGGNKHAAQAFNRGH